MAPSGLRETRSVNVPPMSTPMRTRTGYPCWHIGSAAGGALMDATLAPAEVADSTFAQRSTPRYGIVVARDVMVPMRDGVRLATDIYRPAIDGEPVAGRFPTILGRTSYDKTDPIMWVRPVADYFVPRGYAVVLQDLRGRQKSEGTGQ